MCLYRKFACLCVPVVERGPQGRGLIQAPRLNTPPRWRARMALPQNMMPSSLKHMHMHRGLKQIFFLKIALTLTFGFSVLMWRLEFEEKWIRNQLVYGRIPTVTERFGSNEGLSLLHRCFSFLQAVFGAVLGRPHKLLHLFP